MVSILIRATVNLFVLYPKKEGIIQIKERSVVLKIILVASTIVVPLIMIYLRKKISKLAIVFNILAVIFVIIFGSIASTSIYQIIIDDAVFMTKIHALFLNELFLISGAYIGLYVIYRLMVLTLEER